MEIYCQWLEHRMMMDDVYNTDAIRVDNLEGYDPYEVMAEMAKRNPHMTFAWEDLDDDSGDLGRFHLGRFVEWRYVCRKCPLPDDGMWWTDMIHEECDTHAFTLADLERMLPSITERYEAEIDRDEDCCHPNSQCFPQGGCGCSCGGCGMVED